MAKYFSGNRFYDYHKAFSAKAAALQHQIQGEVDWSIRDNGLFCPSFAGVSINVCELCASIYHASDFCTLMVHPNLKKQNPGNIGMINPRQVKVLMEMLKMHLFSKQDSYVLITMKDHANGQPANSCIYVLTV